MKPNSYLEVDSKAIEHNTNLFRKSLNEKTKIISVIKANGYGLGIAQIAQLQEVHGIDMFAVLDVEQGKELRDAGITRPILLLGAVLESNFQDLITYDLIQVAFSYEGAKRMSSYALNNNVKIKVHVKVDTGLNRLGMTSYEEIKACYAMKGLDAQGIYSHFIEAQSDEAQALERSHKQIADFDAVVKQLKAEGIDVGMTHLQNSPSVLNFGDLGYDAVRCGMIMFGLFHPSQLQLALDAGYKSVIKFKTHIAVIRDLDEGDTVGYSQSFKVTKPMKVATLSTGYCDGIMKGLSLNGGGVVINDVLCPILGDIAMSQFMVDVSHVDCSVEDIAVVFGHPLQDVYATIGITKQTINEFISHLRYSMERVYI